jgi:YjbR
MTPERFRSLALELPGASEGAHHDHPDFRAHGRVFASLHPDGVRAMVRVPPAVQQRLCESASGAFVPANGAWGRAGCTMFELATAPLAVVRDALRQAWEFAAITAAAPARKPRSVPKAGPATAGPTTARPAKPGSATAAEKRRRSPRSD